MIWLILSLLTALAVALGDTCIKKFFSHLSAYEMSAYPLVYSFPLFAVSLLLIPVPALDATFLWCFLACIPLNGLGFVIYMKAIKISPLSLTVPYLAFTPAFMIVTGFLFLNEMPNLWGISGIMIVVAGSYILNITPGKWNLFAPFQAIFREKGSWMMLLVSFIYSFASVIGKKGILHSSPLFFTFSFFGVFNLLSVAFLCACGKIRLSSFRENPLRGFVTGGLIFLQGIFQGLAMPLTKAAYMISVKRLSIVFGVIFGSLIFKEENLAFRLGGAMMMLAGTLLISFQGL